MVCCGFDGMADPALEGEVDSFRAVSFARLGSWARFLRRHGCREAIMVGRVRKQNLYMKNEVLWALRQVPDFTTFWAWFTILRKDRRSETAMLTAAAELEKRGITLIDSTTYCRDQLATAGVMGTRQPSERQQRDMARGWEVCGWLTRQDIGQGVAVKDLDIVALEAVEGTNRMIERAGELCRGGGWTLVKRANTRQDMRLDVPSIGLQTIEKLRLAGAQCLCVEAGRVILLEKEKVITAADAAGIAVVGRAE